MNIFHSSKAHPTWSVILFLGNINWKLCDCPSLCNFTGIFMIFRSIFRYLYLILSLIFLLFSHRLFVNGFLYSLCLLILKFFLKPLIYLLSKFFLNPFLYFFEGLVSFLKTHELLWWL